MEEITEFHGIAVRHHPAIDGGTYGNFRMKLIPVFEFIEPEENNLNNPTR